MANNIIQAVLDYRYVDTRSVWQYDYGQILRIQGENLPKAVEVHFSLNEVGGDSITKIGVTTDGITEVQVPDELLENGGARFKYNIYAFVYTEDGASGNTEYRVRIPVQVRPKPSDHVTPDNTDIDPFGDVVKAVNNAAERAEASEQKAKEHAASASESAVTAEKTKEDALRKVGEKKREAIEAIQNQEETSIGKITTHTDGEIQRIQNQTTESKGELEQTIINAGVSKEELDESMHTASDTKTALDKSVELAGTTKTELDTSTQKAGEAKTALDGSVRTAGEMQETLSATVKQAGALDTSLGEKIETGTQLKTDLVASGEKAVQDIQTAGSEQLGKMQAVAEAFTADREQIATNKEDIGSLKEDLSNKITKFYASNQGETHITDSDNGKIQDMIIYGRSSQFTTTGKNLAHGKNEKYYINTSVNLCGFNNNDIGMAIDVSNLTNVTISTRSIQDRYRIGCVDTVPTDAKTVTCYNGRNKDGTKDSYTIDTKDYNYLIVNATKLEDIQVEKGSEATSYEPYTGGIPSPSPDYPQEIKRVVNPVVKVCRKNLWNPIAGGFISNLDGSITAVAKSHVATTDFIKTNGKDIAVIARNFSLEIKDAFAYRIGFYDAEKKWIKNIIPSDGNKYSINTFNITDAEYIRVSAPSGVYDTIQIEIGSEATSYEPYTEQSVQLPYTLNAIPVASGGNVTIDGQQYIADRVVEKDGVFGIERNIREIHTNTKTMNNSEEYPGWNNVEGVSDVAYYNVNPVGDSGKLTFISNFTQTSFLQNNKGTNNILCYIKHIIGYSQSELIAKAIDIDMYIRLQDAIFEPLPGIYKLNCEPLSLTTQ